MAGWTGDGDNIHWSDGDNWVADVVPAIGDGVSVGDATENNVTIDTVTNSILIFEVYQDAVIMIVTGGDLTITDDGGDSIKLGDFSVGTVEISGTGTLSWDEDFFNGVGNASGDGTLKITGSSASINGGGLKTTNGATGLVHFVADSGGISTINAAWGDNTDNATDLIVDLTAYLVGGESSFTLMNCLGIIEQGIFDVAAGAISHGATDLTLGTEGALLEGEYFIAYDGGTGNDVVLSVSLASTASNQKIPEYQNELTTKNLLAP